MTTATYDHVPSQSGGGLASWVFSIDHKRVGIMYLVGALAAFVLAALMALGIRLEQYAPGESGLIQYFVGDFGKSMSTPDAYNSAAHVPRSRDDPGLRDPRADRVRYELPGSNYDRREGRCLSPDQLVQRLDVLVGVVLALLFFIIPDKLDMMWTGYPPYAVKTTGNTAIYFLIVQIMGFSSILGAINFITTTVYMRAPGMGWNQMNMFVWGSFFANVLQLIFLPFLSTAVTLLFLDKYVGTGFFDAAKGGDRAALRKPVLALLAPSRLRYLYSRRGLGV